MLWDRLFHRARAASALPATLYRYGVDALAEAMPSHPAQWPELDDGLVLPRNSQAAIIETYGDPRSRRGRGADRSWERSHMTVARGLSAIPRGRLYVHRLAEPRLREALRRVQLLIDAQRIPADTIRRIGCFNYRHMRHDTSRPLSRHSWGIAIDINPADNHSRRYRRGQAPAAWSPDWRAEWPAGLPELAVRAFTSCGWAWGADWDQDMTSTDHTYIDPMHFELVDRRRRAPVVAA